jgi:hypothetical protein
MRRRDIRALRLSEQERKYAGHEDDDTSDMVAKPFICAGCGKTSAEPFTCWQCGAVVDQLEGVA